MEMQSYIDFHALGLLLIAAEIYKASSLYFLALHEKKF